MKILYKRYDGSYTIEYNENPYHLIERDEPLWTECQEALENLKEELEFDPNVPEPEDD